MGSPDIPRLDPTSLWLPGLPSSYTDECAVVALMHGVKADFDEPYDIDYNAIYFSLQQIGQEMSGHTPLVRAFGAPVSLS